MASGRTELSPQDKGKILAYMENFNPSQIAKKMSRDPTTIRCFIGKYKKTEKTENLPRSGRPPVLNNDEKSALVNEVMQNRHELLHEIINILSLNCSIIIAKRTLYVAGIHSYIATKQTSAHVSWCEKYKEKLPNYWKQVIFSDESSVKIEKQSRQIRV